MMVTFVPSPFGVLLVAFNVSPAGDVAPRNIIEIESVVSWFLNWNERFWFVSNLAVLEGIKKLTGTPLTAVPDILQGEKKPNANSNPMTITIATIAIT